MLGLDAVVVYRFFGLSLDAIFALERILVTIVIIAFTVRIPFKTKAHWAFLVANAAFLWGTSFAFMAQSSTDPATAHAWYHYGTGLAVSAPTVLLEYQFVVYFMRPKPPLWQKCVLFAGYAWVAATVWIPILIGDFSFVQTPPRLTSFGWTPGPGTDGPYLFPDGIDVYFTIMSALILFLLVRHYLSENSPLVKGQTMYLILGMVFIIGGSFQTNIARYTGAHNLPTLQNPIAGTGDLILLLGLRRKGFYSVTPTVEAAASTGPIKYPLVEGRSYLASDPRAAFESFSELARSGGREGLLITRSFPTDVRSEYGLRTTPIRWLAESKGYEAIAPEDLLGISLMVKDFLEKSRKPVVMIHGLEYLTTYNGFTPILRLIQGLTEEIATRRGILILPVVPEGLDKHEEALLSLETTPMPGKS